MHQYTRIVVTFGVLFFANGCANVENAESPAEVRPPQSQELGEFRVSHATEGQTMDSPNAVFKAYQEAAATRDPLTFFNAMTKEMQDFFILEIMFCGWMSETSPLSQELAPVLAQVDSESPSEEAMIGSIKNREKFFAEAYRVMYKHGHFRGNFVGELRGLQIDGDAASAMATTASGLEGRIGFVKSIDGGWRISELAGVVDPKNSTNQ